ncbi:hypothetical protein [Amycolatopsis sp. DG1A-15b]|uniref:hypothetical protein n=1 Tax=Amycolatopsis sp. DG1A-15b TaxID=3052846 RepID=UPI00255BC139|nr:hypothetical protein [Amycolatopsis sp. DG1A-15b]WIX84674.1 hypothetical protein QRY02_25830 [Amycolatopsis sp. DG1A-15b]
MVHDDELSEPEITTNTYRDLVSKGTASRPPDAIRRLIVAEAGRGLGVGEIREAIRRRHGENVRVDWVVYVLEELRKASDRRS